MPTPWRFAFGALVAIALFAVLYLARAVLLPIAIAILLSFLFRPLTRSLKKAHIPDVVGAAMVLALLLGAVGSAISLLAEPAVAWAERAPEAIEKVQERLHSVADAVRRMSRATSQVQALAKGEEESEFALFAPTDFDLRSAIVQHVWSIGGGVIIIFFLLYFLLASGDLFLRKVVRHLPKYSDRKQAVLIARTIEHDISRYLFTVALINTALGSIVGTVMFLMGMPNPVLWGAMAGLLNFIPYLGPMVTLTVLAAVSLLTFESLSAALLRPAVFFALTTLEGQLVTPLILGRRLMLNPVVIFVGLIFWGWLWGIIGALLAVPLTMIMKLLCDSIPPLRPVGDFLAR